MRWLALATCCALQACAAGERADGSEDRRQPQVRILRHLGGEPGCLAVVDGLWFQAMGTTVEIIDPADGTTLRSLSLGEPGDGGRVVDMAVVQRSLLVVLDRDAVCEVNVSDPLHANVVRCIEAADLGIVPRRVSIAGNEAFISGSGGVVRWRDRQRFLAGQGEIGAVAGAGGHLVACVGRRVVDLDSGAYLGAASDLQRWPGSSSFGAALVFALQGESATTVGLMTSAIREIDRVVVHDPVRRVRVFAERIWIVTDQEVIALAWEGGRVVERLRIPVEQAVDVGELSSNQAAVSARGGVGAFWIDDRLRGKRWLKEWRREFATGLTDAWSDGRRVVVRNRERCWSYSADEGALREVEPMQVSWPEPQRLAAGVWGRAEISEDGRVVNVTTPAGAETLLTGPRDGTIGCVASIEGQLWLGTTQGISVVAINAVANAQAAPVLTRQDLRIDGDVFAIFPRFVGNGAVYVTRYGGIGVVDAQPSVQR